MKEAIQRCPVCDEVLTITKLTCKHCEIEIQGEFKGSRFSQLRKDELDFIEAFVIAQGNIKEMERLFKVSYPTIKKTLEGIILKLDSKMALPAVQDDELLTKIKNKEITVDEAVQLMKGKR